LAYGCAIGLWNWRGQFGCSAMALISSVFGKWIPSLIAWTNKLSKRWNMEVNWYSRLLNSLLVWILFISICLVFISVN
jgi:hypothetical protein